MNITQITFESKTNVCPKCHKEVKKFQLDDMGKTCECGFYYTNKDIKTKVTKYKMPEIESEEIV